MKEILPEVSESQLIGQLANRCFIANLPENWMQTEMSGDDDFGLDYQVQVSSDQRVGAVFRVQLKGTKSPLLSKDREYYSISLSLSTINYYVKVTEPILLVLADLSAHPTSKAKDCPLFYCWIHDELKRINLSQLPDGQKTVTIHVPCNNQLTETTDLSSDIARANALARVGNALDTTIEKIESTLTSTDRVTLIGKLPNTIAARGIGWIESFTFEDATLWPNPPRGSLAWYLTEADQFLKRGRKEEVATALDAAKILLSSATPTELPEYWFLRGCFLIFEGLHNEACEAFLHAVNFGHNKPKYLAAWAESELTSAYSLDKPSDFSHVLVKLTGVDPVSLGIKARLLAAEHKYDDALILANSFVGVESLVALCIIHTMQSQHDLALDIAEQGLATEHIKPSTKLLFMVMKARARFNLAVGEKTKTFTEELLPPTGLPDTNIELLNLAWSDIQLTVKALQSAGWPPNVEFLADIWAISAGILGKQKETFSIIVSAADARPHLVVLQSAAESISAQCEELSVSLRMNARQPQTESGICRRIATLHFLKDDAECINLLERHLATLDKCNPIFSEAMVCAIVSANRIVRPDLVSAWLAECDASANLAPARALAEYLLHMMQNPLDIGTALTRLEESYEKLGRPHSIALNLFVALDVHIADQAEKSVNIANELISQRFLDIDGALHLAQALITLKKWNELLELSTGSLRRFKSNDRLAAIEALALDKLGRSSEARIVLERLIGDGATDAIVLNTYINIAVRFGLLKEAVESIERILSKATNPRQKIECLRNLYRLIHLSDPNSARLADLVWRIGGLVDQSNEFDEGMFLSMMLMSGVNSDNAPTEARIMEFQKRASNFFENFPNSEIIRRAEIPDVGSKDEIWRSILKTFGLSDEQLQNRRKLENQLHEGTLPVPYAWRPRLILGNIRDLPTLWEIGKRSKFEEREYQLNMVPHDWVSTSISEMRKRIPLMDFIALLVAHDLNILEKIFQIFPKIAISQGTLAELGELTSTMTGCAYRDKCLAIQGVLRKKFDAILQPQFPPDENDDSATERLSSAEVGRLINQDKYLLYSDDYIFRFLCGGQEQIRPNICSLDILYALEADSILSTSEIAKKIALLCSWRVFLIVDVKYQRAILPRELIAIHSVEQAAKIINEDVLCMALFNGIWDISHSYQQIQEVGGVLLRELIFELNFPSDAIVALFRIWYIKARLREEIPLPPMKILCLIIFQAIGSDRGIDQITTLRLWNVFKKLVELEYGNQMDEKKEKDAISLMGKMAADVDMQTLHQNVGSTKETLSQAFVAGTSDSDTFLNSYSQFMVETVARRAKEN